MNIKYINALFYAVYFVLVMRKWKNALFVLQKGGNPVTDKYTREEPQAEASLYFKYNYLNLALYYH